MDFKTDLFTPGKEGDFVRFYKLHVQMYADEWSRTFGYPAKEAGLYYTQHQK